METTKRSIVFVDTRWNLVRTLVLALLLLAFILLLATFPQWLLPPAAFASGLGMLFCGWSLLKASKIWARCTLTVEALLFLLSLTVQMALGSILQALPSLLLAYVIILFSVEALDLVLKHSSVHSRAMYALQVSRFSSAIQKSIQHVFHRLTRLSLLFGTGFILALGTVALGDLFASISPVLSDISVYMVVVSISLALLLIFREDSNEGVSAGTSSLVE